MVDLNKVCGPEKCCFCLPLRKGLLCVGYIKLDSYEDAVIFLKAVASIVPLLLDFIFTLTSIVAGHKKCVKLFEVYIFYCATMVLVYGLAVVLVCCADKFLILYSILFPYSWYLEGDLCAWVGCGAVVILLQTYLTILVRSQIKHLKAKKEAKLARQRSSTSFRLAKLNIKK